jgi:transcription elongation factor GreA
MNKRLKKMLEQNKYFLTKKGLEELKKEYKILKELRNAKTKDETPNVLESEELNPEYLSFQEDLELLETRLVELENVLENFVLIKKPDKSEADKINLGAVVTVQINDQKNEFMLVGTLEANPDLGKISDESPVGQALLGHKIGDEIIISSPNKTVYKIKNIKYN